MNFNVIDYLLYHADVAFPAIILMVIVSTIYLIFYGIRPIKTRFSILFLLSIVSLLIFVVDNPLYSYFGSTFSGLLFVFYYMMVFSVFYVPFSLIAFIKSLLHLIRFQTKYSILLIVSLPHYWLSSTCSFYKGLWDFSLLHLCTLFFFS